MVDFPQNHLTEMIELAAQQNRMGGRNAGVASATPLPTVQSAAVGRPVDEIEPMSAEERERLDKLAIEAGIRDPRLGNQATDGTPIDLPSQQGGYASLEEAMAIGASVQHPVPTSDPTDTRQTAREFLATRSARPDLAMRAGSMAAIGAPRIPNFANVEGIDLIHNTVVLDGLVFPITPEQSAEFKQFVVETARAAIMAKLEEAVAIFSAQMFQPTPAEALDGSEGEASTGTEVQP